MPNDRNAERLFENQSNDTKPRRRGNHGGIRMKITEDCINHNALRLIEEIVQNIYETPDGDWQKISLGEIAGIIDLARTLKEVLTV